MTEEALRAALAAGWTLSEVSAWWFDGEPLPPLTDRNPPDTE